MFVNTEIGMIRFVSQTEEGQEEVESNGAQVVASDLICPCRMR